MALFQINRKGLSLIRTKEFSLEKELQGLVEQNLETVFNCRFVASEFRTGDEHGGRIDTLALSEDNNPVIIEYKKVESSELVNQSLYYTQWLNDHKGDFQVAAQERLGKVQIDWSEIRTICIAPDFKKYDLYAVQAMGVSIELWKYSLFSDDHLHLDEVFRRSAVTTSRPKEPQREYSFEEHLTKGSTETKKLAEYLRENIQELDETVVESPKKFYVAYKVTQNFVCLEVHKKNILLYLKLNPDKVIPMPKNGRDVRKIGHYGTGDFELAITNEEEGKMALEYVKRSFEATGG